MDRRRFLRYVALAGAVAGAVAPATAEATDLPSPLPYPLNEPADVPAEPPWYQNFYHLIVPAHARIVANGMADGFIYANATDNPLEVVLWVNR